ncbi:MAG: TetR family transcriptional regulator [Sphingobium sp.]
MASNAELTPGSATRGDRRGASMTALLDATAEILSEATRIEASLSEISKRSKVNSAMVKYYFGDKEGLFLALLDREAETAMKSLSELVSMDISATRKLRIHIQGIINSYYRSPYLNRLIHYVVESGRPEASERVSKVFIQPMMDAYRVIVAQGVAEGTLIDVDPGLLYYSLVGAADHIFFASYSVPTTLGAPSVDAKIKQQYTDLICTTFLKGLSPD